MGFLQRFNYAIETNRKIVGDIVYGDDLAVSSDEFFRRLFVIRRDSHLEAVLSITYTMYFLTEFPPLKCS